MAQLFFSRYLYFCNQPYFHLLGQIDELACRDLQWELAEQASLYGKATILLCEHPRLITVGRQGSWRDIRFTADELRRDETTLTGALNYVRNRLSNGAQRMMGLLDDDDDLPLPLPRQLDPAMQRTARLASLDPNDGIEL